MLDFATIAETLRPLRLKYPSTIVIQNTIEFNFPFPFRILQKVKRSICATLSLRALVAVYTYYCHKIAQRITKKNLIQILSCAT